MAKKPKQAKPLQFRKKRDKQRAFLAAFVETASVCEAAKAAKLDRKNHYRWMVEDHDYPAKFEAAHALAGQTLQDDAVHWARVGVFEPIIYQGQFQFAQRRVVDEDGNEHVESYGPPLGVYRRSEGLMARLLKRFLPAAYAERNEVTGAGGGPIESTMTVEFVKPKAA